MNKKHKRIVLPVCILIGALLAVAIGAAAFYNQYLFYGELGALVLILLYLAFHLHQVKNDTSRYLAYVAHHLSQEEQGLALHLSHAGGSELGERRGHLVPTTGSGTRCWTAAR